ncbi:hypothetical protein GGR54DRAFT_635673 [Hypoxylon sp. NC1633]|nr:hypothetical protein GGR54DRAFT_635673 [Hypoxylon sp. NC1633]
MQFLALPQEIILLVCEELATRRDFHTLFQCSLVSHRVASIALEQLYSIQEHSPASTGDAYSRLAWPRLWQSIILSSIGKTAYPYSSYIRTLSLGNLEDCVHDTFRGKDISDFFFSDLMNHFFVRRDASISHAAYNTVDINTFIVKCTDSITEYIKRLADDNGTTVALEHLEGSNIPYNLLPTWIGRLEMLTSLRIRDGSVVGIEAARAIAECCPNFMDLTCYYCMSLPFPLMSLLSYPYRIFLWKIVLEDQSSTADEDLATFFHTIRPNSLRSFQIISQNGIGASALTALNSTQAKSLRSLILGNLSHQAMRALNLLSSCTSLETLRLENDLYNRINLEDCGGELLSQVSAWMCSCKSLRNLNFCHVRNALTLAKDIMSVPEIRLTSLSMIDFIYGDVDEDSKTWSALSSQTDLESLTLGLPFSLPALGLHFERYPTLGNSICQLKNLTSLNLMHAYVTASCVQDFAGALPKLSEFLFSGDIMDDTTLECLAGSSKLKMLSINATTNFSYSGIRKFASSFDAPDRRGLRVDLLNQACQLKLTDAEHSDLQHFFRNQLKGQIDINYIDVPDELREEDDYVTEGSD